MKFKTFFYGGLELRNLKERTIGSPIANAALPNLAIVPLVQHAGAAAKPLVAVGAVVKENMPIGQSPDGVMIHAPIPGVVQDIREISLADGRTSPAVFISLSGGFDRTGRDAQHHDWQQLAPAALLELIREMGVVCMGNSAIPVHTLLESGLQGSPRLERLVINAMESEPYQTADYRLLAEKTGPVLEAVRIIQHLVGPLPAVLALSADYRDLHSVVKLAQHEAGMDFAVQVLPAIFPQGDDRLLVQALFRQDPERSGPSLTGGNLVITVSTLYAIYEAVVLRRPLTERVVTLSGELVRKPLNLRVRIGTPISWLLEECGGLSGLPDKIVVGGPLTGHAVSEPDVPVTKQTRSILVLGAQAPAQTRALTCVRCGNCVRVCPAGLDPQYLARLVAKGQLAHARHEDIELCSECGLCSHACPSRVPLVRLIREGKAELAGNPINPERKTPWPSQVC